MGGKRIKIGDIRKNNAGLEYRVLDRRERKFLVEFLETGYTAEFHNSAITTGHMKDKLAVSVCGVGSVGYAEPYKNKKEYVLWINMMKRCYCENNPNYRYYGMNGVTVCDRWHRFDMFLKDIPLIKGYDKDKFENGVLCMDKDILSGSTKTYSLNTVMFVTDKENQDARIAQNNKKNIKIAIHPDGREEEIEDIKKFCEEHGIKRSALYACLDGRCRQANGFRFYHKNGKPKDTKHRIIKGNKMAIFPDGTVSEVHNVREFCKDNNINITCFYRCINGEAKSTKGFRFYLEEDQS